MRRADRKQKTWILLLLAALLLLVFLFRVVGSYRYNQREVETFFAKDVFTDYQEEVNVEDIDYESLRAMLSPNVAAIGSNFETKIKSPREIRYYKDSDLKGDATYTISKGTVIDIEADLGDLRSRAGSSVLSFPTYETGLRFARPFVVSGDTEDEMYYVKLADLRAVIKAFVNENPGLTASRTQSEAIRQITLGLDNSLYDMGSYASQDLAYPLAETVDFVVLSLAVVLFLLYFVLKRKKAK